MTQAAKTIGAGFVATTLVAMSMTAAVEVHAAGLGELQASSGLGQPFEGRIDVSGTPDELESTRASIAPESAYDDAGLIRAPILDSFQVQLVTGQGQPYLKITSRQRVGEPLLQLVLDLRTGGNTVRREYSVLLDPPRPLSAPAASKAAVETLPQASAPVSTSPPPLPVAASSAETQVSLPREKHGATKPRPAPLSTAIAGAGRYGPVTAGETLGSIAEHLRDQLGGSFQSRVDAIRRANPAAFESSRPGWVRLGSTLVIPGGKLTAAASTSSAAVNQPSSPILSTTLGAAGGAAPFMRFQLSPRLATVPLPIADTGAGNTAPQTSASPAIAAAAPPVPASSSGAAAASLSATDHSWWRRGWSSVWFLLILICLAVLGWLWWTRRRQADADREAMYAADEEDRATLLARPAQSTAATLPLPATSAEAPNAAPLPAKGEAKGEAHHAGIVELEEGDRGFYGEVAQLLLASLAREPSRLDLRMKLLEVYYDSRESELFHKHARHYLNALEGREDEHWLRIQQMGRELLPEAPLFNAQSANALALAARPLRFYEHDLADTLEPALQALAADYRALHVDPDFRDELLLNLAVIRPPAAALSALGPDSGKDAARVWCKWERIDPVGDAVHINAYSQAFLASRLDRSTVISATTSGRHGIAVASAAAELGMGCRIHMYQSDHQRRQQAVKEMEGFGASIIVHPDGVAAGDTRTAALRDWLQDSKRSFYINSLAAGPNPYPNIVRDFLAVLGAETKAQVIERFRKRPLAVVVGRSDGPSAISILQAFLDDRETALYCIDAEQTSVNQAYRREHSWLQHTGRVQYLNGNDADAAQAMRGAEDLGNVSLGSARAAAFALKLAAQSEVPGEVIVLMRRDPESMGRLPANEPALPRASQDQPEPGIRQVIGLVRSRR